MPALVPHPAQTRRRTPQSGKQRKAQLRAERQRREADDDDDDDEAEAQQEAVVRDYHTDARGYRWRRAAAEASTVLVGMVVQRARGGGVVVRLSLVPGATSAAPAGATDAIDPAQLAVERLQRRMKALQNELSVFTRFKPSQVGGQRWASEAAKWAATAQRVAAVAADPGVAASLGSSPAVATELFLLLQHALQAGPLVGSQPAKFKPFAATCRQAAERAGGEASDAAQHPFAAAAAAVLDGAVDAAAAGAAFSAKQRDTLDAWRKGFDKSFGLGGGQPSGAPTEEEEDGLDEADVDCESGAAPDGDARVSVQLDTLPSAGAALLEFKEATRPAEPVHWAAGVTLDDPATRLAEFDDFDFSDDGSEPVDGAAAERALRQLEPWLLAMETALSGESGEPELPCQILPHLLLGDMACASHLTQLKQRGVTHVLNMAGEDARLADDHGLHSVEYLEVAAMDLAGYDILQHWPAAAAFIQRAFDAGGLCLVHCAAGINRSGFVACAELMLRERLTVLEAAARVRAARGVVLLNESFRRQLLELAQEHALLGTLPPSCGKPGVVSH